MGGKGSGNREERTALQRQNWRNSPTFGENQYNLPADEEQKKAVIADAVVEATRYFKATKVKDEEDAEERIGEYFAHCIQEGKRPTVENLALCLGTTRKSLHEWETGAVVGPISSDIVKKAKEMIATFDAELVANGRLNPIAYIFRAKNYYGMRDQAEYVLTPNTGTEDRPEKLIQDAAELPD